MSRPATDGLAGRLAQAFVASKLTPLLVIAAVLVGTAATITLPREEEPQIRVPMVDVFVAMPGASAAEVAERVTRPMNQLLWEVPGVEYVYGTSQNGGSMTVVRFLVGMDVTEALSRLQRKLEANYDRIPQGVGQPLIKPRSIDDVPILALTVHGAEGAELDHYRLRRVVAELQSRIKQLPDVAETTIIGGLQRQVRVVLDPERLASRGLDPLSLVPALQGANRQLPSGTIAGGGEDGLSVRIETGTFFHDAEEVADTVVGLHRGKPVYLREVATIHDGPELPDQYVFHARPGEAAQPAVTLTVAKRPGTNAIDVVAAVQDQVAELRGTVLTDEVAVTVSRDYGATAAEKSDELLFHMGIAVVSVALLILLMLGWREAIVVLLAIPATLGLTLVVFQLVGYTLNRITLFALIFSIGILVDDAIVVVENIVRHRFLKGNRDRPLPDLAVEATAEVGNPTILATWAVIAAILPMAGVGGLMGPYMRPIPVGASAAMLWSLLVAFIVTPWAAAKLLGGLRQSHAEGHEGWMTRAYRWYMDHLIHRALWRWGFLVGIVVLLGGAMSLVALGIVRVKMLPFDNKSEFQVLLDMPEGTPVEDTLWVARELGRALDEVPEVTDFQIYAGTSAPFTFNGLVRHYYLRAAPEQADLQVNLLPKHDRSTQSHAIAKRTRDLLQPIVARHGGRLTVAEVPPGPPVLQTLVVECYGPSEADRQALATAVKERLAATDGVVDVDWYRRDPQPQVRLVVDKEKAALAGISAEQVAQTLTLAVDGQAVGLLHDAREREDVALQLRLPVAERATLDQLEAVRLQSADGRLVPLAELTSRRSEVVDQDRYHKNLLPVVYVVADVAGAIESPAYAILDLTRDFAELSAAEFGGREGERVTVHHASMPSSTLAPALKWDGEWQITLEVFRDLGIAFAAVCVLIYLLMVGWFKSFVTPLVVMAAIPFSLVGILPGHAGMDAFFTATSMIGFMAGAGIVVRNSIILVDFIELRLREGQPIDQAVIDAGAVRFRPMLLTAMAVVVGAGVILFDPIFQGLAISLMAGEIASLLISRMAVPVLYHIVHGRRAA